jgi:hypothetical protein
MALTGEVPSDSLGTLPQPVARCESQCWPLQHPTTAIEGCERSGRPTALGRFQSVEVKDALTLPVGSSLGYHMSLPFVTAPCSIPHPRRFLLAIGRSTPSAHRPVTCGPYSSRLFEILPLYWVVSTHVVYQREVEVLILDLWSIERWSESPGRASVGKCSSGKQSNQARFPLGAVWQAAGCPLPPVCDRRGVRPRRGWATRALTTPPASDPMFESAAHQVRAGQALDVGGSQCR